MPLLKIIRRLLVRDFIEARPRTLLIGLIVYLGVSWLALYEAGETDLIDWPTFLYWIMVTASTVGYGDLSPQSELGRWIVAFFVIPVGLGLFALTIGRVAAFLSNQWKRGLLGLKTLDAHDHVLVLGWNGQRTLHLLNLLLRENQLSTGLETIVLCVTDDIHNPLPKDVEFVRARTFTDDEDMARARLEQARSVIIDIADDHTTMAAALYCHSHNATAHLIAYFRDDSLANLLKVHCPTIECTPSVSVEMLAKSAFDPGSSALHHDLLNVEQGQSQFSIRYEGSEPLRIETIFIGLKRHYRATLLGVKSIDSTTIELNPAMDSTLLPGSTLFYIAESRLRQVDWRLLTQP